LEGVILSETRVIDVVVDQTEIKSLSKIGTLIADETEAYTTKYGVREQLNKESLRRHAIQLLVERSVVGLSELVLHISEDGLTEGNVISGKRIADLVFRFHYK